MAQNRSRTRTWLLAGLMALILTGIGLERARRTAMAQAEEQRQLEQAVAEEQRQLQLAIAAFSEIRSGLEVGLNVQEFSQQVRRAKLALEDLDRAELPHSSEKRAEVGRALRGALDGYLAALSIWQWKIESGAVTLDWGKCLPQPDGEECSDRLSFTDSLGVPRDAPTSIIPAIALAGLREDRHENKLYEPKREWRSTGVDALLRRLFDIASAKIVAAGGHPSR